MQTSYLTRVAVTAALSAGIVVPALSVQRPQTGFANEPACQTLTSTAQGGPSPRQPSTLVVRWFGASNHEFNYRDTTILMNAYYDRPARTRPIGVTRDDIKRANAIYIGHGHADHMADAPYIAERTGAKMFGGPPTMEHASKIGLPEKLAVTVRGGEIQKYNGFSVQAILAIHADGKAVTFGRQQMGPGLQALTIPPLTDAEKQHDAEVARRGTGDPRVNTEGTIAYLFTFDDGFRLMFVDSAGEVSPALRDAMNKVKATDLAFVAYQGFYTADRQIAATMPLVRLLRPSIFMPTHHDEIAGVWLDMAAYPLFMAIRDEMPTTRSISPLYRTPVCINTSSKEVFVGN